MFFFFSSRRRHTRFDCDWSSDVCSSDLERELAVRACIAAAVGGVIGARIAWVLLHPSVAGTLGGAFAFYGGGLSVWGGLGGAFVGVKVASRNDGVSLREIADHAAPSFAL